MKVIVVGAGIIGALCALRLAEAGASVTVVEAGRPAAAASGASFGWINASFYADRDHFNLRAASMAAHRRLSSELGGQAHRWAGCLCWEQEGDALDRQRDDLRSLGYAVEEIDRARFRQLEPAICAPERALRFAEEGAVDLPGLTHRALAAAASHGARLICGVAVSGLDVKSGQVYGVRWSGGTIAADRVVLTTGTATEGLLADVGVNLPMLDRPGLLMRTAPLPPLVSHVLVAPGQEMRQDLNGCLVAPTAASHQGDNSSDVGGNPEDMATHAAARLSRLLDRDVIWTEVSLGHRPVPRDGLPVMGACGPVGLYVATMHSGATLAPLAAEIVTAEVRDCDLSNTQAALIAPYRPQRFTS